MNNYTDTIDYLEPARSTIPPLKLHESWAGRRLIEALSTLNTLPDLSASVDMRFQQKQQQEREQRRLELTGELNSTRVESLNNNNIHINRNENSKGNSKDFGNGKVRQMFDERRRAGIDRSNPLKPILTETKGVPVNKPIMAKTPSSRTSSLQSTDSRKSHNANANARPAHASKVAAARSSENLLQHRNLNGNTNSSEYSKTAELHYQLSVSASSSSTNLNENNVMIGDYTNNNYTNNETSFKLNPVITKKSPKVPASRSHQKPQSSPKSVGSDKVDSIRQHSIPTNKKSAASSSLQNKENSSLSRKSTSSAKMAASVHPPINQGPPPDGMSACRYCGRHFNSERIQKHENVCQKIVSTKRKVFDITKQRIKGTDLEDFGKRKPGAARAGGQRAGGGATAGALRLGGTPAVAAAAAATGAGGAKQSNWRQKHEEFIQAIRAAKQVQAHLARGGKLSDLPPPPPSVNPDYIQCPHCLRRFNQTAAERHIPKCATMLHNKPKPGAANAANKRR